MLRERAAKLWRDARHLTAALCGSRSPARLTVYRGDFPTAEVDAVADVHSGNNHL